MLAETSPTLTLATGGFFFVSFVADIFVSPFLKDRLDCLSS
jgi:hypothetical protein